MVLPATETLLSALNTWSDADGMTLEASRAWRKSNIPWKWTPERFQTQTSLLCDNNCSAKELLGFLVHGVEWSLPKKGFDPLMKHWHQDGPYLKAWVTACDGRVPEESIGIWAQWWSTNGPAEWKKSLLGSLNHAIDDYFWAQELGRKPQLVRASRKSLSGVGSLELMHCVEDRQFQLECTNKLAMGLRQELSPDGELYSGALSVLEGCTFQTLAPSIRRLLLINTLMRGDSSNLTARAVETARQAWSTNLDATEQQWWESRSTSMSFSSKQNATLLQLGVHPLSMVYRDKGQTLSILEDLRPDLFRDGYLLNACVSTTNTESFELPDLNGP